jgi:SAM-dependent methyltransferase
VIESPATSYDEVPYKSYPFPQSHPDRLATVATLLGLSPPPVARCRVLELGCAAGGNLIPMAWALPAGAFVGIDLSARQVTQGRETVRALGLRNVELRHGDIRDVGQDLGLFDYVICHGVYSRVPAPVQDKILAVCAKNLEPDGVAYVSYNTYPGWHFRGLVRDLMCYHAGRFAGPEARVGQARALLDFLAAAVADDDGPYTRLLRAEVDLLRRQPDSYVLHDHLEECNAPIYFHQFVERAASHGLRYLGEADLAVMVPANFRPEVERVLQRLSADTLQMEQYMDFVRNRMFRQTLLCHQHLRPEYLVPPARVAALHVASPARPLTPEPDLRPGVPEGYRGPDGATVSVADPLAKAALSSRNSTARRSELVGLLQGLVKDGVLAVTQHGRPVAEGRLKAILENALEQRLAHLARNALLTG